MSFFSLLVTALALTVLVEFVIFLAIFRSDPSRLLAYSLLINSFTNPLLNYFYNYVFHEILALEIVVVLVESILIMALINIKYPKALLISLAANLASASAGFSLL